MPTNLCLRILQVLYIFGLLVPAMTWAGTEAGICVDCSQPGKFQSQVPVLNKAVGQSGAWIGFKIPTSEGVPPAVMESSKSVYMILYPHGESTVVDLEKPLPPIPDTEDWWRDFQITNCQKQNLRSCPVFHGARMGTAFAFHNRSTLATALHTIHDWISSALKENPSLSVKDLDLPIVIMDSKMNLVNSPVKGGKATVIYTSGNDSVWKKPFQSNDEFKLAEHIEIRFDQPILGAPLQVGKRTDLEHTAYLVGYPNKTDIFGNGKDAIGDTLSVSSGILMRVPGKSQDSTASDLVFTNAASYGNSGGPLLSEDGKVMGLAIAGQSVEEGTTPTTMVLILNLTKPYK